MENDPPNRKLARLVQVLDEDIPSPEEAREAVARMGIDVGAVADNIRKQIMENDSPHVKALRAIHASDDVLAYASTHTTAQEAWDKCKHPDWLAWLVARLDPRQGALVAYLCARSVAHLTGPHREEIERLLDQIEAWTRGDGMDLYPIRRRLWTIYGSGAYNSANSAAAAAADAAVYAEANTAKSVATAAGVAASAAASSLDEATGYYLCNLIRSAVPVCPLKVMP